MGGRWEVDMSWLLLVAVGRLARLMVDMLATLLVDMHQRPEVDILVFCWGRRH